MKLKKLISLLCVLAVVFTVLPNTTLAAEITALDLSENKTRFTAVGEYGTLKVYGLTGAETERARGGLIDNSLLEFSSSNTAVVSVDENGGFIVNAEGIAIITVKYGTVESAMVVYCEDASNRFIADSSNSYIETANDVFRGKSNVLKVKAGYMLTPGLTDTTYVMGGWFYDSADAVNTSINYKFGPRSLAGQRILWGAYLSTWTYLSAWVMSCPDAINTVAVRKNNRIKGWHQFFTVVQRVDGTTHYMTFFDGELVLKGTTSTEVTPYYIDMMDTLCQEVYVAPYSQSALDVSSINVSNGDIDVPVDTDFEVVFNRTLDESSDLSVVLKDTVNNQDIEIDVTVEGNTLTATPLYDLANDNGYKLIVSGSAVSVEDMFTPSATVEVAKEITFTTEKAEMYAENLLLSDTDFVNFSADIVNNGSETDVWLITAQYTADGVQKHIAVEKTEDAQSESATPVEDVPVNEYATLTEGYVWTGFDSLDAESLSAPASTGVYARADAEDSGSQATTYADVGYSPDNGLVEVHGYSATKRSGLPVLVRVIRPDKDYSTVTKNNVNDIYARVEQVYTGEGGRIDYKFELQADPGLYKVIVNIPFASAIEEEINFASRDDVYRYMGYVQNPQTHPETTDPAEIFEEAREVLDLNYTKFDTLNYKNIVYSMLDTTEDFDTFRAFSEFFAEAVDVVYALETNDMATIEMNKTNWGIGNLSVYEIYDDMLTDEAENVHSALLEAGFNNYETLSDKFAEIIILKELKSIDNYSEIYPILQSVSDCFENDVPTLNFTEYENLSETKQGKAMKALSLKLSGITSKADLIAEFNDAVLAAGEEGSDGSSGDGSPNYSGGLSGGSGNDKTDVVTGKFETEQEDVMGAQDPEWVEEEKANSQRKVFDDLDSVPWAEEAIRELYNRGIIAGKSEKLFAPNDYLTREELAKMLICAMNLKTENAQPCNLGDVNNEAWYAPYVNTAVEEGIIQGAGDGNFGIGLLVNREEICTIADRAAQAAVIYLDDEFTIRPFFDEKQISSWALYSVNKMRESFVITGVGGNYFNPKAPVTRAQAAKIIYGVLAYAEI